MSLLSIRDLRVAFRMGRLDGVMQRTEAVKGVSFDIPANTTVALVGESGSGKSVTAMSILNLLPDNAERSGAILWGGKDLLQTPLHELQRLRGKDIACVFQDPMSSLSAPPPSLRRPGGFAACQTNSPWLSGRNRSWPAGGPNGWRTSSSISARPAWESRRSGSGTARRRGPGPRRFRTKRRSWTC